MDGHACADVMTDRERLSKDLNEIQQLLLTIDDETLQMREHLNALCILGLQDEKIHHSNDVQKRYWLNGEFRVAFNKSLGGTAMMSDFLSEVFGFIKYCDRNRRTGSILDGGCGELRVQLAKPSTMRSAVE